MDGSIRRNGSKQKKATTPYASKRRLLREDDYFESEKPLCSPLVEDINHESEGKQKLSEAIKSVKAKYKMLTAGQKAVEEGLERVFKPITNPLKPIAAAVEKFTIQVPKPQPEGETAVGSEEEVIDEEDKKEERWDAHVSGFTPGAHSSSSAGGFIAEYLSSLDFPSTKRDVDRLYGIKRHGNKYYLGDREVNFNDDYIFIEGAVYQATIGLCELLFKKKPNAARVHETDIRTYKRIMEQTNAHRKGWATSAPLKTSKSFKYERYIKPLFSSKTRKNGDDLERERHGTGMTMKKLTNCKRNVLYWNDPNELVARLVLLHASTKAGNNVHGNEILAIEEELREAGIIV